MVHKRFGVLPKKRIPIGEEITRRDLQAAKNVRRTNEIFDKATKKITRRKK